MKNILCAGAIALAMTGVLPAVPAVAAPTAQQTSVDVARIKNVLQLTPEQEPLWPPVEAALRGIARQQAQNEEGGLVKRVSRRIVSVVLDGAAVQRLATAARPLIASLDMRQMSAANGLVSEMGLGPVVAAMR